MKPRLTYRSGWWRCSSDPGGAYNYLGRTPAEAYWGWANSSWNPAQQQPSDTLLDRIINWIAR